MINSSGTLRIIAGKWRSRKVTFHDDSNIRPTPDRIRETVFSWLQHDIVDAKCLDCFAGSGAMGFEALSRGAKHVTFLDNTPRHLTSIKRCAATLECTNYIAQIATVPTKVSELSMSPFDVIFLDPPFKQDLLCSSIRFLQQAGYLLNTTLVYFECERSLDLSFLEEHGDIYKLKTTKSMKYGLLKCTSAQ